MAQYTITGFDASAHTAEETTERVAHGGRRHVDVGRRSVVFGWILLLAVTFAIPSTERSSSTNDLGYIVPSIWVDVDGPELGGGSCSSSAVVAQFFCLTASVTSASRMMFAFSRDGAVPGPPALASRGEEPRPAVVGDRRSASFAAALMIPAIWNYLRRLLRRHRRSRSSACTSRSSCPCYLRFARVTSWDEPRAWSLGKHYKWIDPISIALGVLHQHPVPDPARTRSGCRGRTTSPGSPRTTRSSWFAGIGAPLRRLVGPLGQEVVQGPGANGHRGRARAARGRAGRPVRASDRSRRRARRRSQCEGRRTAPLVASGQSAAMNAGDAAVRSSRSKCSDA